MYSLPKLYGLFLSITQGKSFRGNNFLLRNLLGTVAFFSIPMVLKTVFFLVHKNPLGEVVKNIFSLGCCLRYCGLQILEKLRNLHFNKSYSDVPLQSGPSYSTEPASLKISSDVSGQCQRSPLMTSLLFLFLPHWQTMLSPAQSFTFFFSWPLNKTAPQRSMYI